jgi:hypothetical protein
MKKLLTFVALLVVGMAIASACTRQKASCKKAHKSKKSIDRIQYQ